MPRHDQPQRSQSTLRLVFSACSACSAVYVILAIAVVHADGEKIAVFTKNQTNPYFQMLRLGAENAAKQMNARVTHYVPTKPDSIPDQMSQIEDVITKRPDAVVFVPVDFKAVVPGVQKMNAAHIPVVNVTDRVEKGQIVTFVGSDDYSVGLATARYLFKKMNGTGGIIILEGVRGVLTSVERLRGFKKALEEFPNVKLLASQPANYQRLAALDRHREPAAVAPEHQRRPGRQRRDGARRARSARRRQPQSARRRHQRHEGSDGRHQGRNGCSPRATTTATFRAASGRWRPFATCGSCRFPRDVIFPVNVIDNTNYKASDIPDSQRSCPKWEMGSKPGSSRN